MVDLLLGVYDYYLFCIKNIMHYFLFQVIKYHTCHAATIVDETPLSLSLPKFMSQGEKIYRFKKPFNIVDR